MDLVFVCPHSLDIFIHQPYGFLYGTLESGVHWCLRVVLNLKSEILSVALPAQLVIYVFLKDKLKNLDIPENTKPGPGEVECGYLDELAEEKDTDVGAEELDDRDALIGDEEMLGEIEADGHHGTPAIKVISTWLTKLDQTLPSNYWTYLKFIRPNNIFS